MKSPLFVLLVASASAALPSAVLLPAAEIASRESAWLKANPSGFVMAMTSRPEYGAGNSMRPMIHPKDRQYFEAYVGQNLRGSVALVQTSYCALPVAHMVYDETATHVYMAGIANRRSDGWQPKFDKSGKCLVRGVLVGILRSE